MRERAAETLVVRENEIRLVRRSDSDKWQAHFKVEAINKWIRKATKQADVDKALILDFHLDLHGLIPVRLNFKDFRSFC